MNTATFSPYSFSASPVFFTSASPSLPLTSCLVGCQHKRQIVFIQVIMITRKMILQFGQGPHDPKFSSIWARKTSGNSYHRPLNSCLIQHFCYLMAQRLSQLQFGQLIILKQIFSVVREPSFCNI